jgi:hypothetical protein
MKSCADLLFRYGDFPGSDKIADRLQKEIKATSWRKMASNVVLFAVGAFGLLFGSYILGGVGGAWLMVGIWSFVTLAVFNIEIKI